MCARGVFNMKADAGMPAVQQALEAARKEASKDPENEAHQTPLQQALRCAEIMQERGDKK